MSMHSNLKGFFRPVTSAKTVVKEFLTDFLDNLVSRLVEDDISNKIELPGEDVAPACLASISKVDHSVALPTDKKRHLYGIISMMSGWI